MAGCIPVLFTPPARFWLAFWDILDWRRLAVFIPNGDVLAGAVDIVAALESISDAEVSARQAYIASVQPLLRSARTGLGCDAGQAAQGAEWADEGGQLHDSCLMEEVLWGLVRQQAQAHGWTL